MHTSYMYMYINIYNIRYAYFYLEKWASFCSDKGISLYCRSNDIASSLCTVIQVQLPLALFFFLLPCVDFCFPIVPMGISILCRYLKILGSKSTWHSLELLQQLILFIIIMYVPLRMIPLIIQATLFISFTSFYYG